MEKPGYKTTEAWISVLSSVLLILVSYGLLSQTQADALHELIAPALPLVLSVVPTVVYVVQRSGLKKEIIKTEAAQLAAKVEIARLETMAAMASPVNTAYVAQAAAEAGQPTSQTAQLRGAAAQRVASKGTV